MGSVWEIRADGHTLLLGKNYVPDTLMTIFRNGDQFRKNELIEEYENLPEYREVSARKYQRLVGYRLSVKALRERLRLMGFSVERVRAEALRLLAEELEYDDSTLRDLWAKVGRSRIPHLDSLLDSTIKQLHEHGADWLWDGRGKADHDLDELLHWTWDSIDHDTQDLRFLLAVQLSHVRGSCSCVMDLTDLVKGGWLDWSDDLVSRATLRLQLEISASGKIIVITEGSTDAAAVQAALHKLRPDVSDYFTFLDFAEFSAPGGVDRVVSLTKGLAAASVMNRVVVLLDNDTAGRHAENQLSRIKLPPTFAVTRLPEQRFARKYPTVGPSGSLLEDVNSRACSIEFMFGEEVMRIANGGSLPPVQWKSTLPGINDYQGEVTNKASIQSAIRKLLSSRADWPPGADRSAGAVIDAVLAAAHTTLPSADRNSRL